MVTVHHLNCLKIETPINKNVIGHCLLLEEADRLVLIDVGVGLLDTQNPQERIGQQLIDMAGFRFDERLTAVRQIEQIGFNIEQVTDCVITHLDPDHIGALADFPNAIVHVGAEELENFGSGNWRYLQHQLSHQPNIKTYAKSDTEWFGFEARKVHTVTNAEIYLVPLFGHTLGHCGVAIKAEERWLFYIGDAYYMKVELTDPTHPVNELATIRADDNELRKQTLNSIQKFIATHPDIEVFSYHDIAEFPGK
jgi:glyoxylase-like metal-dependent hydrolase (beta-lactamase superfamily II)